jgi:hypothetical protein
MTDYIELTKDLYNQGKLEESSIARERKKNLIEKIKYLLINSRINLESYWTRISRLVGNRRIYFDEKSYEFKKSQNQL